MAQAQIQMPYLVFDLLGCVREEDGGVGVTCTHFGLCSLESWKECGVEQGWLRITNPWGDISGHSEVRILEQYGYTIWL